MNFLNKLKSVFSGAKDDRQYWFYVQCAQCGEILKGRVDLYNHLSIQYGEDRSPNTYYCRKVLVGSQRCYRPIETEFTFSEQRKLISREIKGGQFVAEEDYLSAQN